MSRFNFKTFTSFLLVLTFLALTLSGTMLFLSPTGRIAHWTGWTLLGLGKEEWGALHILMALVFLMGSLFHLLKFNWRVFLHYLKTKRHGFRHHRELLASIGLFSLVLVGTLIQISPFTSVIALHEEIKGYWEEQREAPPIPHMENMSLGEVASNLSLTEEHVAERFSKLGLKTVDESLTLAEIAEATDRSPQEIYSLLRSGGSVQEAGAGSEKPGRGLGRRTLAEITGEMGIPVDKAIEVFEANGVKTLADDQIRDIASRTGMSPHELLEILEKRRAP